MANVGQLTEPPDKAVSWLIRADQLAAVRRSVLIAIPVNMVLGLASALVAMRYGHAAEGSVWFAVSTAVNVLRIALCRAPLPARPGPQAGAPLTGGTAEAVDRQLRLSSMAALLSGLIWAFTPILCDGYTSPQTLFYLAVTCGITAGAVTHGTAYAKIPVCFITPPLLLAAGCLLYAGGFDRNCLAATVVLYLLALTRGARESEAAFRQASRLKNEATALALSLEEAHARSSELAKQMSQRATHDPLTGLLNRAGFMDEVERRASETVSSQCLMLLDLDGFKSVNDAFGHKTGDRVLVEVAQRLKNALPRDFAVARLGGDEFAVFFRPPEADAPPAVLAAQLITAISRPFETFDAGRIGISIGIHHAADIHVTEMLICADEALYAAKSSGRNRCCLFDDRLRDRLHMRRDIERDLARAMSDQTLELWFQPIFGQGGRVVASLEALVRWKHPVHGWIPPTDLISAAALAGLSEPLLAFIVDEACAMLRALDRMGLGHVRVAINVSPREMAQIAVDEILFERLAALELAPCTLEVEITEETAMDVSAVQGKLARLSDAGICLSIDDFGVGYSSLSCLRQLHAKRVKVDRSFVSGIARSEDNRMLVQAILNLGRSMNIDVIAEGVETAEDLHTLQADGCQFMQGFYLARPMPAGLVIDWLQHAHSSAA